MNKNPKRTKNKQNSKSSSKKQSQGNTELSNDDKTLNEFFSNRMQKKPGDAQDQADAGAEVDQADGGAPFKGKDVADSPNTKESPAMGTGGKDCQDMSTTAQGTSATHSVHSAKEKKASAQKLQIQDSKKELPASPQDESLSVSSVKNSGNAPGKSKTIKKSDQSASQRSGQQVARKAKAEQKEAELKEKMASRNEGAKQQPQQKEEAKESGDADGKSKRVPRDRKKEKRNHHNIYASDEEDSEPKEALIQSEDDGEYEQSALDQEATKKSTAAKNKQKDNVPVKVVQKGLKTQLEEDQDPVSQDDDDGRDDQDARDDQHENEVEGDELDDDYKVNELEEQDLEDELDDGHLGDDDDPFVDRNIQAGKSKKRKKAQGADMEETKEGCGDDQSAASDNDGDDNVFIDNLPKDENSIRILLKDVNKHIRELEKKFFEEEDSQGEEELKLNFEREGITAAEHNLRLEKLKEKSHIQQFWSIPISDNVTSIDFDKLAEAQLEHAGRLFDVITCDPPWQLSSANPTRGVAIAYSTLTDKDILNLPLEKIQTQGFLFIWVINAKYRFALDMFDKHGYKLVDEVAWVKQTVNGKIAKGHGFYLQHAKETCLIGVKGDVRDKAVFNIMSDVIFSQRRGQSQKPEEIYDIVEALVPNGYYLEIFGRRNNLHNGWVTIGNEL